MHTVWLEREAPFHYKDYLERQTQVVIADHSSDDEYDGIGMANGVIASISRYDGDVMDKAPDLLVICRTGIGYDKVDVAAATERGIAVCNAPDGPTISTAEHALMLLFAVAKELKYAEYELRHTEKSDYYAEHQGVELAGKRLGLVGFGRIARHMAKVALAMGMQVQAYDPFIDAKVGSDLGVELVSSLQATLENADVVSVHVPLMETTRHLINADRFSQMKRGAIFINTARGGVVDETALFHALDSGHLFGAGLDVMEPYPMKSDNPLLHRHNVVVTPHIASATEDGKKRIYESAASQVLQVLRGEKPPHLINTDVWDKVLERLKNMG